MEEYFEGVHKKWQKGGGGGHGRDGKGEGHGRGNGGREE